MGFGDVFEDSGTYLPRSVGSLGDVFERFSEIAIFKKEPSFARKWELVQMYKHNGTFLRHQFSKLLHLHFCRFLISQTKNIFEL